MNNNIKLLIGLTTLMISILLFYYTEGGIFSFLRGFLLAIGIVFIVRSLIERFKKE